MQVNREVPLRMQLFTIPNILSYVRLLLIPLFVWRYLTAATLWDYHLAALIVALSGVTDLFDGLIARKFHQVTQLGKILDPVADKLTQGALALCLATRFPQMILLFLLLVVKEGFMAVMGALMWRKGKMLNGAMWFGKVSTVVLYVVMFVAFFLPQLSKAWVNGLVGVSMGFLVMSFILYIGAYVELHQE